MNKPKIVDTKPIEVELEAGKPYFFCACGLSGNQPFCDGSHKGTGMGCQPFTVDETKKAWLCNCKQTKNPPYCDGTHNRLKD